MSTALPDDAAAIGLDVALSPRVDFRQSEFEKLVERSPRFVWERSLVCPCEYSDDQTQQNDPNCTLCRGGGFIWFGPNGYAVDEGLVGELTGTQRAVQARVNGAIIRGFMASAQMIRSGYDKLGTWFWGQMRVTVRAENHIGWYDRLINLDETIVFTERVVADGTALLNLRYPAIVVAELRSLTVRYSRGTHFDLDSSGRVAWLGGQEPDASTILAAHYECHPAWRVVSHPHVARASTTRPPLRRGIVSPPSTPQQLPLQADVRLEFEPEPE